MPSGKVNSSEDEVVEKMDGWTRDRSPGRKNEGVDVGCGRDSHAGPGRGRGSVNTSVNLGTAWLW